MPKRVSRTEESRKMLLEKLSKCCKGPVCIIVGMYKRRKCLSVLVIKEDIPRVKSLLDDKSQFNKSLVIPEVGVSKAEIKRKIKSEKRFLDLANRYKKMKEVIDYLVYYCTGIGAMQIEYREYNLSVRDEVMIKFLEEVVETLKKKYDKEWIMSWFWRSHKELEGCSPRNIFDGDQWYVDDKREFKGRPVAKDVLELAKKEVGEM